MIGGPTSGRYGCSLLNPRDENAPIPVVQAFGVGAPKADMSSHALNGRVWWIVDIELGLERKVQIECTNDSTRDVECSLHEGCFKPGCSSLTSISRRS